MKGGTDAGYGFGDSMRRVGVDGRGGGGLAMLGGLECW